MGLPISRKFVQLMGGEMSVSSEVGRGTLFKFDVLVSVVQMASVEAQRPARRVVALEPGHPPYRILVADDMWSNRQLLVRLLSPLGFEIREASDGQEAVEMWAGWAPHLIWMDIRMPVLDGYQATRRIKEQAGDKSVETAIIALTSSAFEEE